MTDFEKATPDIYTLRMGILAGSHRLLLLSWLFYDSKQPVLLLFFDFSSAERALMVSISAGYA